LKIVPLIEGHGEVEAVPVLLRRLLETCNQFQLQIGRPIRRSRGELTSKEGLERAIRLARLDEGCAAILILFDADDDCPKTIAPIISDWARQLAGDIPCEVVLALREYEAWFLSSLESLRGCCGISQEAVALATAENVRGAKERPENFMPRNRGYTEKLDQPAMTALFSLKDAYCRTRSFKRMVRAFGALVESLVGDPGQWPPADWIEGQR